MAEVGQRLLLVPGSWGKSVLKDGPVRFKKVSPGQSRSPLSHGDPSEKLKECGVRPERKKVKQKECLERQVHTLLMQKTGPLGQEGVVGLTRSCLRLDLRLCEESNGLPERNRKLQLGGRLGQKRSTENHQEGIASCKSALLMECAQDIVLNRRVRLEEGALIVPGPRIPSHLHIYICPIPNNSNFFLSSRLNFLQARGNGLGRDSAQMALVGQHTPHGTRNDILRKCNLVPLQSQQTYSSMSTLNCGARAYSTRNRNGRNGDSDKTSFFRSRTAYYDILGVAGTATQAQIKTAYYRQSFLYHPDRNFGNEEAADRFSEIREAYLILGSVTLRRKYDRGILSPEDVRAAGKPSSKTEGPGAAVPRRTQTSSSRYTPGKPVFDFDEFYRAHYGEQLERERFLKWKREQLRRQRADLNEKWELAKVTEVVVLVFISSACLFLLSLK